MLVETSTKSNVVVYATAVQVKEINLRGRVEYLKKWLERSRSGRRDRDDELTRSCCLPVPRWKLQSPTVGLVSLVSLIKPIGDGSSHRGI